MPPESGAEVIGAGDAPRRTRRGIWPLILAVATVPAILAVLAAMVIVPQISIQRVNDDAARDIETRLLNLPLSEGAELIDSTSLAGKLSGNGNGMQYLGALLIRSEQTVFELEGYYDALDERSVRVVTALGGLTGLRRTPGFLGGYGEPGTFIVYTWGDGPGGDFENSDLRGH